MYILFLIFYFFCCIYLVLINICNIDWVLLVYQFFTAMCYPQKINLLLCNYLLMIMGMIHWTKISGHFSLKLKGLNQKSFKKAFRGGPLFSVGPVDRNRPFHLTFLTHSPNTSHRYRGGHGFESCWSTDFFSGFFFPISQIGKFTVMITLHFHLQLQYKYELFHINFTK